MQDEFLHGDRSSVPQKATSGFDALIPRDDSVLE